MSEENENVQPTQSGKNKNRTIFIVVIILLLLGNITLLYLKWNDSQIKDNLNTEIVELNDSVDYLIAELNITSNDLEMMRGENTKLDSLLDERKKFIEEKLAEIELLEQQAQQDDSKIKKLKGEIWKLKQDNKAFVEQINELKTEIARLESENDSLNTNLMAEKQLTGKLSKENKEMSKKVALGSLLKPENIYGTGVRYRNNGQEKEVNRSKRTEKLKICFDVPENQVTEPGQKTILMRLVGPGGSTIAVKSKGSGVFTNNDGEQVQYTMRADFDYSNKKKPLCLYWDQTQEFGGGTYEVFFYQNGHQVGNYEFELR